ncbi:MAG TPA: DUF455 family protein [Polyangiaceae bacterium]|nr:DUF455 family protein [Polyangiaceae bacterium]
MTPAGQPSSAFQHVEDWAREYIRSTSLSYKIAPPPPPKLHREPGTPERWDAPGRPRELILMAPGERQPRGGTLLEPERRARLFHSFWHHELQAAELMCWAMLAFADAEPSFRKGLLGICLDEIRHMAMYQAHIEALGYSIGAFPVRDWFWRRVPSCKVKQSYVALMGMGLEAANLDHAPSFAKAFRDAGDEEGARIQERVGKEELAHVSFATRWFKTWTGGCDFTTWSELLPPPLSPWLMRADPMATEAREQAGMTPAFLGELAAYIPSHNGRPG